MNKSLFSVPKMDCPSEEKLIRMALAGEPSVEHLEFDLGARTVTVFHESDSEVVLNRLIPLNFGASLRQSTELTEVEETLLHADIARAEGNEEAEAKVLKILLAINATMFLLEIAIGFVAQSTGLIADSLDMLADAAVYGVSLYAVGKVVELQRRAARISGYLQLALALFAAFEVVRRFFVGSEPLADYMIVISCVALVANVICLVLITRHRGGGIHMKASQIFSANDVIANLGVILAGVLVYWSKSPVPDLVIGGLISVVVLRGAISILKISNPAAVDRQSEVRA